MNTDAFLSLQFVRDLLLKLPSTTEKLCFETPAFYVDNKIITRLKEDFENWVVYTEEREKWMGDHPEIYHITPHYQNYKFMLVRIDAVDPKDLEELLLTAWKNRATKKTKVLFEKAF